MIKFGDVVRNIKISVDRENNPFDRYIAGEHMNTEDVHIRDYGVFGEDYVGPAFHRQFLKGQILYGSRRTYLKKVAVADFDGITANTTFVLESKDETLLLQSLLPWIMLTDGFTEHSIRESKGSTNPYINWPDIAKYEFPLPPIEEQRRIAEVLWTADEVGEKWVIALSISIQSLYSLYAHYFFADSDITIKLKDIAKINMGQSPDSKYCSKNVTGIPFYQGNSDFGELNPSISVYCSLPKKIAYPNDILISVRAPVGDINIASNECCIGRGIAAITPINISSMLLYHLLIANQSKIRQFEQGSTFKAINKAELENLPLFLPNHDKLNFILERLEKFRTTIQDIKLHIKTNKKIIRLLQKSFLGMISHV